jgi:hypothetical protein
MEAHFFYLTSRYMKYIFLAFFAFSVSFSAQGLDPHEISQTDASTLIGAFQSQSVSSFASWSVHAGTLPKSSIQWLLNRPGAASLTYYWGLDEQNRLQAIYVATRADGSDILETDGILCPRRNTLHSAMGASNILTVEQAVAMMKRYRKSPRFQQNSNHLYGVLPRESVLKLVDNTENVGIRSYFARNLNGTPALVFVGTTAAADDNPAMFLDRGGNCPPNCKEPPQNLLIQLSSQD